MKIVSWNIQKGRGVDVRRDLDRTAEVLRAADADVIGLQEVLRTAASDQAALLASRLGMELAWGRARDVAGGQYGNALLVRGEVLGAEVHDLSVGRREPRSALDARVRLQGATLRVLVCHFGLGLAERARQAQRLRAILEVDGDAPRIVMGDFNEWHPGPVARTLALEFPYAPRPMASHPSPWPLFALDRMAWDPALRGTLQVSPVRRASDHRMLVATLQAA